MRTIKHGKLLLPDRRPARRNQRTSRLCEPFGESLITTAARIPQVRKDTRCPLPAFSLLGVTFSALGC